MEQDPNGNWQERGGEQPRDASPGAPEQAPATVQPTAQLAPDDGTVVVEGVTYRPAGFMPRLWAFLIDWVILSMFHALLLAFLNYKAPGEQEMMELFSRLLSTLMAGGMPQGELLAQLEEIQRQTRIVGWLNVAVCFSYYTIFHTVAGATLGKMCLGLTVLTSRGHRLGYGTALLRYLVRLALSRFFFGAAFTIFFDTRRRTAYDMAAGTNVFRQVAVPEDRETG